jgi:RimJ/RimL family protein N-acetyltransferase
MFEIFPLQAVPYRYEILSYIMRSLALHETIFSEYRRGCEDECGQRLLEDMCPECQQQMTTISKAMTAVDTRLWEVWRVTEETSEVVGVIYLTKVVPGQDATGHYIFFDHDLTTKTGAIKTVIDWAFEDHEDWKALKRITVEVPAYAKILARHANKKLGFGGPFTYKKLKIEGVKQQAVEWRGGLYDVYIMGLIKPKTS